jgi:hypothetical protein
MANEIKTDLIEIVTYIAARGGPVHPTEYRSDEGSSAVLAGMTLRDHFAGLAMQAMVCGAAPRDQTIADHDLDWRVIVAQRSFAMADEMLRERERQR